MIKMMMCLLLLSVAPLSFATCSGGSVKYAAPITLDLSDKLSLASPQWTASFSTQYTGSFNCTTGNSAFGYTPVLSTDNNYATVLGFSNNKYMVRAEIVNTIPNLTLAAGGQHSASELNTPVTIRFSLVKQGGTAIAGDTANLSDVLFVTDLSGMSFLEIIAWPLNQLIKIVQWLFNGFRWPYDQRDMFGQPMIIKYAPKLATCAFDNAGLTVALPMIGLNQVLTGNQPGYTPFTLNFSCQTDGNSGISDRSIEMFLSSNTLLASVSSVMVDQSPGAAKGIGLRLEKRDAPGVPVVMTESSTVRGQATLLYSVAAGGALSSKFSIPMAAWYFAWLPSEASQGKINTSATLNIIYP